MKIKVCGMRNQSNIEDLIKLKPDYIGFIFYPKSKRFIGEQIPIEIQALILTSILRPSSHIIFIAIIIFSIRLVICTVDQD